MTINAQGYFNQLQTQLSDKYCVLPNDDGQLVLSEKPEPESPKQTVRFTFSGTALAVKLDKFQAPLFHFLENKGHPWSKRCDFVVFHCRRNTVRAYCIEFKTARTNIPVDKVIPQLNAGHHWCESLHNTIRNYTTSKRRLQVSKYLFTASLDPSAVLDPTGRYLLKDTSIRHYNFHEVDMMDLDDMENDHVYTVS